MHEHAMGKSVAIVWACFAMGCGSAGTDAEVAESAIEVASTDPTEPLFWSSRCQGTVGAQRVHFSRYLSAPVEVVFPYLTYEDRIDWLGPFHMRKYGAPYRYGTGSIRVVGLDSAPIVEETVWGYEWQREVTYGVTRSASYKNHCGVMRVTKRGVGTQFEWDLAFDAKGGPGDFLRSFTESYLKGHLDTLERRVEREAAALSPNPKL